MVSLAMGFASAGAKAISVLTEPTRFGGSLSHLEAVADSVDVAVMRKDFLVDPIQVLEARAAGASGVLVVVRLCSPSLLVEMVDAAVTLGMFVLVEVFDEADLAAAEEVFDRGVYLGVNSRDLTTLAVNRRRLATLARGLPPHLPAVAESGVSRPADAAEVARLGYRAVLVGTALVTSADPVSLSLIHI